MDNVTLIRMEAGNVDDVRAVLTMFVDQVTPLEDEYHYYTSTRPDKIEIRFSITSASTSRV